MSYPASLSIATTAALRLPRSTAPAAPADSVGSAVIDSEMIQVARLLWPGPQSIEPVAGGLFNRVLKVSSASGTHYLKRFTEVALSGDFPPLPTRAAQRCLVACSWHDLASRACVMQTTARQAAARQPATRQPATRQLAVPALVAIQSEYDIVAMDAAAGTPLYERLTAGAGDKAADAAALELPLSSIARWLGRLHALPLQPRDTLLAASRPFKAFKIELQYVRLIDELPPPLHRAARAFIDDYLMLEAEPVHGDLNSRNLLVDADNRVSVIDFEQGHFGEGSYDLAYLLSEYAIRALHHDRDPLPIVARAWDHYGSARLPADPSAWQRRLHLHLAFQCLYRLVGPTRAVWTGHLDEAAGRRVREWSLGMLERLL
jgi:aminoglycoside phosphotransferase (APT) family kinase protein